MKTPNVLLIITDQQARRAMGAVGNPYVHTPNMDSLADHGVLFERAYCASPVCGPSRNSLYTGLMPHQTGSLVNSLHPRPELPSIGKSFSKAGFDTAWAGGWGMPQVEPGVKYLSQDLWGNIRLGCKTDSLVTDQAIEFLERDHSRPFMLSVCLTNPHDICWSVRKPFSDSIPPDELPPIPDNFAIDPNEPDLLKWCRQRTYYGAELQFTKTWSHRNWQAYLWTYYRLVEKVDIEVGRLLTSLRDQGLEDDTLVVFTSDHGEGLAAHQCVVKLSLYEDPVSVPLVVSWKGVTPQGVCDQSHLASGVDVFPTLCDYAGIECPNDLSGMSLRPIVECPESPWRDHVTAELYPDTEDLSRNAFMVRSERYKYVRFSEGPHAEQLFDLSLDAGETRNLIGHDAITDIRRQHRQWADDAISA